MKIHTRSRNPSGSMMSPLDACLTEADNPSRRTVLRGALAAGCSLLVPAALLGCDRETQTDTAPFTPDDTTGTAPMTPAPGTAESTSPAPGTGSTTTSGAGKVSQASVQYQDQPKGDQSCANCIHFVAPNACAVVEGVVRPEGWCVIWVGET